MNEYEDSGLPLPLVERSSKEIEQTIKRKVESLKGVESCNRVYVRVSGKKSDISISVSLDPRFTLEETHKTALAIEKKIKIVVPNARVSVNTEPFGNGQESLWKTVKKVADETPGSRGVHNIHVQKIDGKLCVDLHLEVSANMTVMQAHNIADQIEKKTKHINPNISDVAIHIESTSDRISREQAGIETELESHLEHIAENFPEIKDVCNIRIRKLGDNLHLVLYCRFDSKLTIGKAHEVSTQLENAIRKEYPNVARIDIHEEPT